jgi:hypothetical protein
VSLAFLWRLAHNQVVEAGCEQSHLVFNEGSGVTSTWAFNSFKSKNIVLERVSIVKIKMLLSARKIIVVILERVRVE